MERFIAAKNKHAKRLSKGFTLVELVIVMAIVAILVAIAIFAYTRYIGKAHSTVVSSDFSKISTAVTEDLSENPSIMSDTPANIVTSINTYLDDSYALAAPTGSTSTSAKKDPYGTAYLFTFVQTAKDTPASGANAAPGWNDGQDTELYIIVKSAGKNMHTPTTGTCSIDSDDSILLIQDVNNTVKTCTYVGGVSSDSTLQRPTATDAGTWYIPMSNS